jgi:hypothetical protein
VRYFDYNNSSELKKIQRYFTQEEWKSFCEGLKQFDKDYNVPNRAAERWIKGLSLENLEKLEHQTDCMLAVCQGIDRLFRDRIIDRIKAQNTLT